MTTEKNSDKEKIGHADKIMCVYVGSHFNNILAFLSTQ